MRWEPQFFDVSVRLCTSDVGGDAREVTTTLHLHYVLSIVVYVHVRASTYMSKRVLSLFVNPGVWQSPK